MSALPEELGWSPRRWILAFLLVLTAQFGCVFWFSNSRTALPASAKPRTPIRFFLGQGGESAHVAAADRADPTLFALVTPEGFSGRAWLTTPQLDYEPSHPPEPLRWLAPPVEELTDDFAEFVQTNLLSEDLVADRLPALLAQPQVPTMVVRASTVLRVEGSLAGRRWFLDRPLPQSAEPLLTNTIVRVLVDARGAPLSAALLSSSGVPKADQDALDFCRAVRFDPTPNSALSSSPVEGLASGDLVFQWSRARWEEAGTRTAQR